MSRQLESALPYRPAIFKRGLLLVLVPLIFGSSLLLLMDYVWRAADKGIAGEKESCDFVQHLNHCISDQGDLSAVIVSRIQGEENTRLTIEGQNSRRADDLVELRRLSMGDKEKLAAVDRLEKLFQAEEKAVANMPNLAAENPGIEDMRKFPKICAQMLKIRTQVKELLNQQSSSLEQARKKQDELRQTMKLVSYAGAGLNIVLAVVLVFLFAKSITNRLGILTKNAAKLSTFKTIETHVSGNDEIAYLDKILTNTAEKLKDAAEHRQSIIGMVAHDVRSPLMACQGSLALVAELKTEFSANAAAQLKSADGEIDSILQHVKIMLDAQKAKNTQAVSHESSSSEDLAAAVELEKAAAEPPLSDTAAEAQSTGTSALSSIKNFFLRPMMFHKGLVLVLVPLLIQTTILFSINQRLAISEDIAKREAVYSRIMMYRELVILDIFRGTSAQLIYVTTSSERAHKLAEKIFEGNRQQMEDWQKLVAGQWDWSEVVRDWREIFSGQAQSILALRSGDSVEHIKETMAYVGESKVRNPRNAKVSAHQGRLYDRDQYRLEKMAAQQQLESAHLREFIGWGMLSNFLVSILLLIGFSTGTTRRLKILMSNAERLGQRKSLNSSVKGGDELAYLDLILHQAESDLLHASNQRTQIMSSIAHEMRNPLLAAQKSIDAFEQLENERIPDKSKQQLQRVRRNIERVLDLINELLSLETLEAGQLNLEKQKCDIKETIDEALSAVASLAKMKNIRLENQAGSAQLTADKARLLQVLINYLSNAIKFSGADTAVTVSCQESPQELTIYVSDQGPGMDAQTRERVFEKFFQASTQEKKQGFGLGLAICRLIIESHAGELGVESEPGKGSKFWFKVPQADLRSR